MRPYQVKVGDKVLYINLYSAKYFGSRHTETNKHTGRLYTNKR